MAFAGGAVAATPLTTIRVYPPPATASALSRPVFATSPPGDTTRFFVVEQRTTTSTVGRISIFDLTTNTLSGTPFLTTSGQNTGNEEGLLGLAFHPDFFAAAPNVNRGAFFIYITQGGNNHVIRYTTTGQDPNANTADAASAQTVIDFSHPTNTNHNGGWIAFGPDGYLYIATGDGGSGCDPPGNAQNINAYLGKIHRLDVNADQNPGNTTIWGYTSPAGNPFVGVTGLDEIWMYGLRNPWRDSFDRQTGELYIGDVGQDVAEEVSYAGAGVSGLNYGWDVREGTHCSSESPSSCPSTCATAGFTPPIWDYDQRVTGALGFGRQAVTGGYVYRGSKIPDLDGTYFFADYTSREIWSFRYVGVPLTSGDVTLRSTELAPGGGMGIEFIVSFAEDQNGEMYIIDQSGNEIFKIVVNCSGSSLSIDQHPASQTVCAGTDVIMSVAASGTRGAVTYTWRRDVTVVGGNSPTLSLTNVQAADAGSYTCEISDQCNTQTSNAGTLTVVASPPAGDVSGDCILQPLDRTLFVDVLTGVDTDAGHVARSDLNNSGIVDGDDIQLFVALPIP